MRIQSRTKFWYLAAFAAALALSLSCLALTGRTTAAAKTGKTVIADFDTAGDRAPSVPLAKTSEKAYPYGKMGRLKSHYAAWAADYGFKFLTRHYDWTGAKYVMLWADNTSDAEEHLGIYFETGLVAETGATQYKLDAENAVVKLDDMNAVTQAALTDPSNTKITLPAGFQGYVKVPLTNTAQFIYWWQDSANDHAFSLDKMVGVTVTADSDSTVYVDTLTISYDDDIDTPLTLEEAVFGRPPHVPKYDSGKYVADGYDEDGYYAKYFDTVQSTETTIPSRMWAPVKDSASAVDGTWWTKDIPTVDGQDWEDAFYFMFYLDNRSGAEAEVSVGLKQENVDYRVTWQSGRVYLDDLNAAPRAVREQAVTGGMDTWLWTGFRLAAGFRGYVKVPYASNNIQHKEDAETRQFDTTAPVTQMHLNIKAAEGGVYADTLSVSYDDDIDVPFDGAYANTVETFDPTGTEENVFHTIKDFYGVNKNRDWFDRGDNSVIARGGSVTYGENDRTMTVDFCGDAANTTMWGLDNQISLRKRDWSAARYVVSEVKNELESEGRFLLFVTTGTTGDDSNKKMKDGSVFYLKSKTGELSRHVVVNKAMIVPAGFEGYVVLPTTSFDSTMDLANVLRLSISFENGKACKLTFGRMGYAVSDKILTDTALVVDDPTVYELPPDFELTPAPPRPSTEPAVSQENRTE